MPSELRFYSTYTYSYLSVSQFTVIMKCRRCSCNAINYTNSASNLYYYKRIYKYTSAYVHIPEVIRRVTNQALLDGERCTVYPYAIELQHLLYEGKRQLPCIWGNPQSECVNYINIKLCTVE